ILFSFFIDHRVHDTQTGLRGIPRSLIEKSMKLRANGYEFEFEMLILATKIGNPIKEFSIETIYINSNKASHFDPFFDSLRIFYIFGRFFSLSLITALADFLV